MVPAPPAKSNQLRDYDFNKEFSKERLKGIKDDADRGGFKGLGDFKKVITKAEEARTLLTEYQAGTNHKARLLAKGKPVTEDKLIGAFKTLIGEAEAWRGASTDQGADKHRQVKLDACQDLITGANIAITQMNCKEDLERLQAIKDRIDEGTASPEDVDKYRELDAKILCQVRPPKKAGGGSSDVRLISDLEGNIAYAFKPAKGESDQMGTPKGAGAAREVMMSCLCEQMDRAGLGFQWPTSTLASLDIDNNPALGALIEGLPGKTGDECEDDVLHQIQPVDLQKMALCNLATMQFDIKWDNAFIDASKADQDGVKVRPSDAGCALPDRELLVSCLVKGILDEAGSRLLFDKHNNPLAAAGAPLDKQLRDSFLKINLEELQAAGAAKMEQMMPQVNCEDLGVAQGLDLAMASMVAIRKILSENPDITLAGFMDEYKNQFLLPTARDMQPAWENDVRPRYVALQQEYPGLLADEGHKGVTIADLYTRYLDPTQKQHLDEIQKLGGANAFADNGLLNYAPLYDVLPGTALKVLTKAKGKKKT
jgi:hypothetical protein